jgi:uncharacterized phage infection (PIP) family protein YhgE
MSDFNKSSDDWASKAQSMRDQASSVAQDYSDRIQDAASDARAAAEDQMADAKVGAQHLRDTATALATDLKSQADAHIDDAKSVISSMADEARSRIAEIIDQQKSLGADKLSGISRAAQNAAGDLEGQNPHVARLVRDAAGSVDRIAGDLRSSSLSDVVASVSDFARKQPVAFFAGSVLAGFVLARFIKSEPTRDITKSADRI